MMTTRDLDQVLVKCVDEILGGVLGRRGRDFIYLQLLTRFSISKDDMPRHLADLLSLLEASFGTRATRTLSKHIAKRFYLELHIDFREHADFDLERYVIEAERLKPPQS